MTILDTIADYARKRVQDYKAEISLDEMASLARTLAEAEIECDGAFSYPFQRALQVPDLSFICEVKKASPSKGVIVEDFPYKEIARTYDYAGAAAISCLTEPKWFLGRDEYLSEIVQEVSIPVLRKDFVVDEYMIYQSKVIGAQAVLLICAILDDEQLEHFGALAHELGLSTLVEAHDAEEIKRALAAGASIVGVNNRDLNDFSVDFENARKLRELVPADVLYVAESGVKTVDDVVAIAQTGADAVLIGEALMREEDKITLFSEFYDAAVGAALSPSDLISGSSCDADSGDSVSHSCDADSGETSAHGSASTDLTSREPTSTGLTPTGSTSHVPTSQRSSAPSIKICGLTQPDDIEAVNDLLPDYVGFVFSEQSKRYVTPDEARALRAALDRTIAPVGVFVDAPIDEVAALFEAGVISVAQLHGTEDEAYIQALRKRCPELIIWKAFEIKDAADIMHAQKSSADFVLLDAGKGSGTSFDWSLLAAAARPFALAGGLNPDNVCTALDRCASVGVMPEVVDVSSGVEIDTPAAPTADGRSGKDPAKMAAFVRAVRNYRKVDR